MENVVKWIFAIVFLGIGILNAFIIHPMPGIFYMLISLLYAPPFLAYVKRRLQMTIPYALLIIVALALLWATLAVGDLAEYFGL